MLKCYPIYKRIDLFAETNTERTVLSVAPSSPPSRAFPSTMSQNLDATDAAPGRVFDVQELALKRGTPPKVEFGWWRVDEIQRS